MFIAFTPFSYLFLSFYAMFMLFLFSCSNFVVFWVFIEFIILTFIGLAYTMFSNNFSSLMLYFLVQTLSSFSIFLFYLYPLPILLSLSFFLNLSMFPFHFWFLNVCYRFPNFVLFLTSSLHNVPVFFIILFFSPTFSPSFFMFSILATVALSGCMILSSSDFRSILLSSSVGNNSWFFLSSLVDSFTFLLFFSVYAFFLLLLLLELGSFSKPFIAKFSQGYTSLYFYIVFISGLPPFPLFFIKILIVFSLFVVSFHPVYLFIFVSLSCLILVGYLYSVSKYFVHSFCNSSLHVL